MTHCIVAHEGEGVATFCKQKIVRARKEYPCNECGETIKVGHLYERATGLWEDRWGTYITCARCVNIRKDYFYNWHWGFMVQDFEDNHGFDYRNGLPPDFAPCKG